jgi:hypothetical protein
METELLVERSIIRPAAVGALRNWRSTSPDVKLSSLPEKDAKSPMADSQRE